MRDRTNTVMGDRIDLRKQFDELSNNIAHIIEEHLEKFRNITDWSQDLKHPVLRVDAFLEEDFHNDEQENTPSGPVRVASVRCSSLY